MESESGAMEYGVKSGVTVGPIPHLLPPEVRDRENAEREAKWAAMSPMERAALEDVRAMIREELRRA